MTPFVATRTYRDVVCSYPLMLFTANNGGTADEKERRCGCIRPKYIIMTLFRPTLPGSDGSGRATLYDRVGQKYLEPHGSFVMGETKVSNGWSKVKKSICERRNRLAGAERNGIRELFWRERTL